MQNHYFVVEPAQIVAQDLAHAVSAVDTQAQVHLFRAASDALAALENVRPAAVFLHRSPSGEEAARIVPALEKARIPYAFTGPDAEIWPAGSAALASPFTEATVATVLRQLIAQVPATGDEA